MITGFPSNSSSSTSPAPTPPSSSTGQQGGGAIPPNTPVPSSTPSLDWLELFEKWAIPALVAILTGVIGFYSSIFALSDKISENKSQISILNTKADSVDGDIHDLKEAQKKIQQVEIDLAVIKTKMESKK